MTTETTEAKRELLAFLGRRFVRLDTRFDQIISDYDLQVDLITQLQELSKNIQTIAVSNDDPHEVFLERLKLVDGYITELESSLSKKFPPVKPSPQPEISALDTQHQSSPSLRELNRDVAYASFILGEQDLASAPMSVNIDPSITCNFRCRICHHAMSQRHKRQFLPVSVIDKLDMLFDRISEVHIFGGGEPTLSPTLDYLLEKMHRRGIKGDILTNGSTLGKRALPLAYLEAVGISFDGASARTFQAIRHGSRFNRLLARIRAFKRTYPSVRLYFNVVLSRVNIDELPGIVSLAADLGVSYVSVHRMTSHYPHHRQMELTTQDIPFIDEVLAKAHHESKRRGVPLHGDIDRGSLPVQEARPAASRAEEKEALLVMLEDFPSVRDDEVSPIVDAILRLQEAISALNKGEEVCLARDLAQDVGSPSELCPDIDRLAAVLTSLEQRLRALEGTAVRVPSCAVPWFRSFIRADGTVRPCPVMNIRMGCIESQGGFGPVWNSASYQALRTLHALPAEPSKKFQGCEGCTFSERAIFLTGVREYAQKFNITIIND